MAQKGIIKNTTTADISAANFAAMYHGIIGKSGILTAFNDLACTKLTDNSVQIDSGVYSLKGYVLHVEAGTAITLTIDSGTAGQNRNDLVVAELVKNGGGSGIDTLQFRVIKGTSAGGTAVDPTLTQQDVNATGVTRQEALYRVKLTGVTLSAIEQVAELIEDVDMLKTEIEAKGIVASGGSEATGYYTKFGDGRMDVWGKVGFSGSFGTGSSVGFTQAFPALFVGEPPTVTPSASMYNGTGNFESYRASGHISGVNLNNFFGHLYCEYALDTQNYMGLHYRASGKWK